MVTEKNVNAINLDNDKTEAWLATGGRDKKESLIIFISKRDREISRWYLKFAKVTSRRTRCILELLSDLSPLCIAPSDLIQYHCLKYHLYTDSSQMCSSSWMNSQTLLSNCVFNISTWISTKHFKLNIPKTELPISLPSQAHGTQFSLTQ
jgi:hypothetical protein